MYQAVKLPFSENTLMAGASIARMAVANRKRGGSTCPESGVRMSFFPDREAAALNNMTIASTMTLERDLKMSDQPRRGLNERQLEEWNAVYDPIYEEFKKTNPTGEDLTRFKYQRYLRDCAQGREVLRLNDSIFN